ncbi:lactonase family protein [Paenibacillus aestuarii]|uniref:Lactonase family protein n=1 Tax=Paenibacillus aestuarii TaxID=516965 RepID=A0ABW0KES3_9BACL|nr:lactonase family protein [Paenibacillus aestuarii]
MKDKQQYAFIGSYAESDQTGLYACSYDQETGSLTLLDQVSGLPNPTFLDIDESRNIIYALTEGVDANQQRCGAAAAYAFDPFAGKLLLLNKEVTLPATTCHITLDRARQCLMVASYHGGMVGLSPLLPDGRIGATSDIQRHQGASVLPVQDRPRAHSVTLDRANRFAIVCDLGLDQLVVYKLDAVNHRLIPHSQTAITPGSGPRHFAFHPNLPYGYVINELNATITVLAYEEEAGQLNVIQTVSTLPADYQGDNACADIHISPDGRFIYGSNRGHDSLAVYAIDAQSGRLTLVEHASTLGGHPRNFAISPDGRFVLVANRDGNNIVSFSRDAQTGKVTPTGSELKLSKPVCMKLRTLPAGDM